MADGIPGSTLSAGNDVDTSEQRSMSRPITVFEPPKVLMAALTRVKPFTRRGKRMLDIRGMPAPLLDTLRDYCSLEEAHDHSSMARIGLQIPQEYTPTDWDFWEEVAAYQRDFGKPD